MPPHHAPVCFAGFLLAREVFPLVGDEPGQPDNVADLATGRADDRGDVQQRLLELADEIVPFEFSLRRPADLATSVEAGAIAAD